MRSHGSTDNKQTAKIAGMMVVIVLLSVCHMGITYWSYLHDLLNASNINKRAWSKNLEPASNDLSVAEPSNRGLTQVRNKRDLSVAEPSNRGLTQVLNKRDLKFRSLLFSTKKKFRLLTNLTKPLLTIFTTWNSNPEKYLVHNLTTHNWMEFWPYILPVVFTNETSVAKACKEVGWEVLHVREAAADGVPVLKYMYIDAMEHYDSILYAYSNSDILFTENLLHTLDTLINTYIDTNKPVLIVGRRTDVMKVKQQEGYTLTNITKVAKSRGKLHRDGAADYFITSRSFPWKDIAPVVVGRMTYDNYLLYFSRIAKFTVIDATKTLLAVHPIPASGNYEGYRHKNKDYNLNVLKQMYKHVRYRSGAIHCFSMYTHYKEDKVEFSFRKVNKTCKN